MVYVFNSLSNIMNGFYKTGSVDSIQSLLRNIERKRCFKKYLLLLMRKRRPFEL